MEAFSQFLINNYVWFLVVTIALIFALIGYIVDSKNKNKKPKEEEPNIKEIVKKKTKEEETKEKVKDLGTKTLTEAVKTNTNPEILETTKLKEETTENYDQPLIVEEETKPTTFETNDKTK